MQSWETTDLVSVGVNREALQVGDPSDPTGTYAFAYDNMGRLISTTTQYTFVAGTYTNSCTYDAASNRASLTAPDGSISTYGYDTLNRLSGAEAPLFHGASRAWKRCWKGSRFLTGLSARFGMTKS